MSDENSNPHFLKIPHSEVSEKTLNRMIESFVLREGTDYGEYEFSLEQKVSHVMAQLNRGEIEIVFDSKEETFNLRKVGSR